MKTIEDFNNSINVNSYISNKQISIIKNQFKELYQETKAKKTKTISDKKFIKDYQKQNRLIQKCNDKFVDYEIKRTKDLLDNINGYPLDYNQRKVVVTDEDAILVVAGAGSGKSLTMIGKIRYLIEERNIKEDEILCISFTNDATKNLKKSIEKNFSYNIEVYTFHKLALEILKQNNEHFEIAEDSLLEAVIHNYFIEVVPSYPQMLDIVLSLLSNKTKKNKKETYERLVSLSNTKLMVLENTISRFIHLMKANNYDESNFSTFYKKTKSLLKYKDNQKNRKLLVLIVNCYLIYKRELEEENQIDFDDMIIKATKVVAQRGISKHYKYIIIDEYQDTSYVRFLLIKNIIEKTNAKFIAVGDDFQSIYRFTGCDLNIFINFKKYFESVKILKIENTYRNSQELIDIAGSFIMKNKSQIKKKLISSKRIKKPVIIYYYKNRQKSFIKLIQDIHKETKSEIMILGRNNKDIYKYINEKDFKIEEDGTLIYKKNFEINLRYLTTHKSKGLEATTVIIINATNKITGFPSRLQDEQIISYVSSPTDKYLYSEERRLFYVALTRTKEKVYIFVSKEEESIFIKELKRDHLRKIEIKRVF